ncbi:hypothetical protein [Malacoplasma iowae]|uniref:hypothetical protein n=1 Tax=Malacoplasma iowae TaxID=2116 RepID=UPI002A18AAC5|nr:hypothetical protein [Malacoplasma iowae]WPL40206.1 hypothetical protein QX183_01480 [Malacoplasma iowae]
MKKKHFWKFIQRLSWGTKMKLGLKFLLNLLSGSVSLCIVTSLPLSIISDINNFKFPILNSLALKDDISFSGNINQILKGDTRADDVNGNLNKIFNTNKKELLKNPEYISDSDLETLKFSSQILNWNNWGTQTFSEWKGNSNPKEITYNKNEIINFESKNQLKNYLEKNIVTIANDDPNAKLADAEFSVDDSGDLLIPITTTNVSKARLYSDNQNAEENKAIIKIAPEKISFNPQIEISGSYGSNNQFKVETKSVSLECKITNLETVPIMFNSDVSYKKEITLEDKGTSENIINSWTNIKDEDIYKKIGWLKDNVSLADHIDGTDMDISMLNEEVVYSDLGISKSTDELLSVRIEFVNGENSRNSTKDNYNGEYKIILESIDKTSNNSNGLNIKNYVVVSSISNNGNNTTPLQVNVPDAYLLDTNLSDGKVMNISKEFFGGESFEIGFKTTASAADFVLLQRNLSNGTIFNRFIEKIKQSATTKGLKISNGVILTIGPVNVVESMAPYKNVITLNVSLKKGYTYKKSFNLQSQTKTTTYKYNTAGNLNSIRFGTDISSTQNQAAIWGNGSKTIEQIVNGTR